MEQLSLADLKEQEAILLRELEIENSEKNNLLQKHRQVLLNSAHLLRLYHQSSKEASEIINRTNKETEISELIVNEEEVISDILGRNGLRLLWDALDNLELIRASLMLEYLVQISSSSSLKSGFIHKESLDYFESQLTEKVIQVLTTEQTDSSFISHTIEAINSNFSTQLVEYLKSELSKDLINGSVKIVNFYNNLKLKTNTCESETCKSINLFVEEASNFCEYPQLKNIQGDLQSANVLELKNNIKSFTSNFFTEKLPSIDPELLKGLELEDELVNNILNKTNELKLKGSTEKLKIDLSDLFDKLMKLIQSTIRSNSVAAVIIVSDDILKTKLSLICETLETLKIPSEEVELILKSFDQIISNKSNIIFTIHRNELSALNSKREIPIPSKLYLASCICDNLIKEISDDLKKEINDKTRTEPLRKYVEQIKNKFYEFWLTDIKSTFNRLKEENNEIYALIWLSNSFLTLQISNNQKSDILMKLDVEENIKYFDQTALLTGLFGPETISTPKLPNLTISEPTRELLPHFISI